MAPPRKLRYKTSGEYKYSSLTGPDFSFRLLQLLPGRRGSPMRIEIDHFDLVPDGHPPYEALSYTWGDPNDKVPITVNRGRQNWSLYVTRNCEEALQYLRLERRPRCLWIDAICINQSDDEEKSEQVFWMIHIYRAARQVIAWLGLPDATTGLAFRWIHNVNKNVTFNIERATLVLIRGGDARYLRHRGNAIINEDEALALSTLLKKSWFSRLWIQQEVGSKTNRAILKCGGHVITAQRLRTAVRYLAGKNSGQMVDNHRFALIDSMRLVIYDPSLFELMDSMRSANCLEPVDRIYVAEAMVLGPNDRIRPTYAVDWKLVYTRWAEHQIVQERLGLLQYAGVSSSNPELPSWVPDWTEARPQMFDLHFAHGGSSRGCHPRGHGCLETCGRHVSELQSVIRFHSNQAGRIGAPMLFGDVSKFLRRLVRLGFAKCGDSEGLTRLIYALTAGQVAERSIPRPSEMQTFIRIRARFEAFISNELGESANDMAYSLHDMIDMHLWDSRAFFTTTSNQMGLCPASCRPGDKIVVILGSDVPLILRPQEHGQHVIIGPAYCDGVMSGEAILGPLPSSVEHIRYLARAVVHPAFRDKTTRKVTFTDPRLPLLPKEWRAVTNKDTPYRPEYEHIETGERRNAWCDPRCDADKLKARGVKLDTFTLV